MKAAAYNMGFGGSRGDATQAMGICWQLGSSSSGTIPGQLLQLSIKLIIFMRAEGRWAAVFQKPARPPSPLRCRQCTKNP